MMIYTFLLLYGCAYCIGIVLKNSKMTSFPFDMWWNLDIEYNAAIDLGQVSENKLQLRLIFFWKRGLKTIEIRIAFSTFIVTKLFPNLFTFYLFYD